MKKIFFVSSLALLGICSSLAATTVMPSTGTNYHAGKITTDPLLCLTKDMTFGSLTSDALGVGTIPHGGNFYAGSYTLSLWVDTTSISSTTTLFGFYGNVSNDTYGANTLIFNTNGTLTMGRGSLNTSTGASTQQEKDTTTGSVVFGSSGGLTNITLSVTGADTSQSVGIYINGTLLDTLTYNGNMNGDATINSWLNPNLTYGEIKAQAGALSQNEIADFAGFGAPPSPSVPEPTTTSLGLLGLVALVVRRRRA